MVDRKRIIIRDEFEAINAADVNWFVHTPASVRLESDGKKAVLGLNGKQMEVRLIAPVMSVSQFLS